MEKVSTRIKALDKKAGIKALNFSYGQYIKQKHKNKSFEEFLSELLFIKHDDPILGRYI